MEILKRILFIIAFITCFPIVGICAIVSAVIMPPICLVIYIIKGDAEDELMDLMQVPFIWAMQLPWKITGKD